VADRVDAAVEPQQPTLPDAVVDGIEGEAEGGQLNAGDDAVLAAGDGPDRCVREMRLTNTVYIRHNVSRVSHGADRAGTGVPAKGPD
jgi:hypothetical protein